MRKSLHFLKRTAIEWDRREAPRLGASLAFYSLFSLAPLLVLVMGICALVFSAAQIKAQLVWQFQQLAGRDAARALTIVLDSAQQPAAGVLANTIGLLTLLLGASCVLIELRTALNRLWGVPPSMSSSTLLGMIKDRFFSFGMVLGLGFLLLVSLTVSAALSVAATYFGGFRWVSPTLLECVNFILSLTVVAGMFALIYRFVPDVKLPWKSIGLGAGVTALLFTFGKTALGIYLGKAGVGSAYGAAGSIVVLVVWIYYSAQIFYFGAIFTHVFATESRAARSEAASASGTASYRTD